MSLSANERAVVINLIGTSPATATREISVADYRLHGGLLTSAKSKQDPAFAAALGARWAMDNDAFTGFQAEPFLRYLSKWRFVPNCLFVVAPDAIQDAQTTLSYFWIWQPIIKAFGLPVAFVLQNGMSGYQVPYDHTDAIFIGGSTDFKYTDYVTSVVTEAKRRGLWVHNGRVNSLNRIQHSLEIGCDSFDGTGYAIEPGRIRKEFHWWTQTHRDSFQFTLPQWEQISC